MAHLRDASGAVHPLRVSHLIGRSRSMNTVIGSPEVSSQHLAIHWTGRAWTARDLGSRNGTSIDGTRLTAGEEVELRSGSRISLGGLDALTLVEDGPPLAFATCDGETVVGAKDMLALPDPEDPVALFRLDGEEGWALSMGDEARRVPPDCEVEVGARLWRVNLPEPAVSTLDVRAGAAARTRLALAFRVSQDEEYVELTVVVDGVRKLLPARTYQEILLTLARARLASAELPSAEQGWVYTSRLLKMVRLSSNQLYVGVHRARREFEALGVGDVEVIERRTTTQQIRLGVEDVSVERM